MSDLREAEGTSTGEILDERYLLRERIGEGGMARVYRAEDLQLRRTVAVKLFRTPTDGVDSVERARSETTLMASLNHPALVTVLDARVSDDGACYLVMEHVEGLTLRELIAQGPLDPELVATIASDIADGLHEAHAAGIVHRDIKPSNVLLRRTPRPGREWSAKVADFGIAYLQDSARVTTPGLLVGTAAYVAPEQARGAAPTPAIDVYAFGIMLIEALTGRRPFSDSEGIGTVVARLSAPPDVPESLPVPWQGLLRGMTATRPDDRPTALEVALTLTKMTDASPPRSTADESTAPAVPAAVWPAATTAPTAVWPATAASTPPPAPVAVGDTRRRRGRMLLLGALGALVLSGTLVGGMWLSALDPGGTAPTPAPSTPAVVEEQAPTPSEEQAPPPDDGGTVDGDDSGPGNAGNGSDNGSDNDNSGPGNNNGNGNDNSGPGNNNGNGNGSGSNSGNGNGND